MSLSHFFLADLSSSIIYKIQICNSTYKCWANSGVLWHHICVCPAECLAQSTMGVIAQYSAYIECSLCDGSGPCVPSSLGGQTGDLWFHACFVSEPGSRLRKTFLHVLCGFAKWLEPIHCPFSWHCGFFFSTVYYFVQGPGTTGG